MNKLAIRTLLFFSTIQLSSFFQSRSYAQCNAYTAVRAEYIDAGWTVESDRYVGLTQGQSSLAFNQYVYSSYNYVVVAFSCDNDVTDVDVFLHTSNGTLYMQDNDRSSLAAVSFSPLVSKYMQISAKNYASRTPYYSSQIRILVFSKYK